jgi:Tfp pilus assembly protein PilX
MPGRKREEGFALILLIGITAALAILAAALVLMLTNQQWNTARERSSKTSESYAEAALNSAVVAVENDNSWLTTPFTNATEMSADYSTLSGAPTVTYQIYDNLTPINYGVNWDSNGDGEVWVQTTTTYQGRTTTVRELVQSKKSLSVIPFSAAWTDTNMTLSGTSNIYYVNADGTPDTTGSPYATTVECGGNFTANSSTTLAAPADGTNTQSVGLQVNGSVSTPGHTFTKTSGGVGMLSDYFDQAHQAALMTEAQTCQNNVSSLFDLSPGSTHTYTSLSALQGAMTYNSSTKTYTASCDLEYNNTSAALTLSTAGTTYNFQKLYVNGALALSGNVTFNATSTYVSGSASGPTGGLMVSGATAAITDQFGPLYCAHTVNWKGGTTKTAPVVTIATTSPTTTTASGTVMASSTVAGPMFAKILMVDGDSADNTDYDGSSGPTSLNLGDVWIDGDAGTGDIAVNFSGPYESTSQASTVMCKVLATTEQTHSNGYVNFGTLASPMVYFMQCDNDGLYNNTCCWDSQGTYYGLMILFEAECWISGYVPTDGHSYSHSANAPSGTPLGNDGTHPNVVGAVLEGCPSGGGDSGTDLTLSNNSSICYNPTVINNIDLNSILSTTIQPVPGTWQELAGT